jgi:hypothetical protein
VLFLRSPGGTEESIVWIAGVLAKMHAGNLKNMKYSTNHYIPIFRLGIYALLYT